MTELELRSKNFKMISTYFNEINDYYWINDIGQIYSTNTNKFLAPYTDRDGYYRRALTLKRVDKTTPKIILIGAHQLVNTIFNGRASKSVYQPVTDHIDGDRTNNYYKNLRWLSGRAKCVLCISSSW